MTRVRQGLNPTVEVIYPSGGLLLYTVIGNCLVREQYQGYTVAEAIEDYNEKHRGTV